MSKSLHALLYLLPRYPSSALNINIVQCAFQGMIVKEKDSQRVFQKAKCAVCHCCCRKNVSSDFFCTTVCC